jgi:hypothetical protein
MDKADISEAFLKRTARNLSDTWMDLLNSPLDALSVHRPSPSPLPPIYVRGIVCHEQTPPKSINPYI